MNATIKRALKSKHWDVFISHATEDKEFVRGLASELKSRGLAVWYDDFTLKVGDRLRETIDYGLANSTYGIIVLSPNYFAKKKKWTKNELDALMAREKGNEKSILPVWHNINASELKKIAPILAERLAVPTNLGLDVVVSRLLEAMDFSISSSYQSLQKRLLLFGIKVNPALQKDNFLTTLEAKFAIDDVIVDAEFAGFRGVEEDKLSLILPIEDKPNLPSYVYKAKEKIAKPDLNKKKAYLASWHGPIIDKGNAATLHIGYLDSSTENRFYDYWTTKAVLHSMPELQEDLTNGKLRLRELARRMDLVVVVVTKDKKLVLARRSENVDNAQGHWMISIGESLDPSTDLDKNGVPNPFIATRRCLEEYDELNLSKPDISGAHLMALGIATEWRYLYANLIVLVQLNIEFGRVKERATDGEHTHVEGVDFTIEKCLPLIQNGMYYSSLSAPIVPASRVALLMSLMSRYGYDEVVNQIK